MPSFCGSKYCPRISCFDPGPCGECDSIEDKKCDLAEIDCLKEKIASLEQEKKDLMTDLQRLRLKRVEALGD